MQTSHFNRDQLVFCINRMIELLAKYRGSMNELDAKCYISDLNKFKSQVKGNEIALSLFEIVNRVIEDESADYMAKRLNR